MRADSRHPFRHRVDPHVLRPEEIGGNGRAGISGVPDIILLGAGRGGSGGASRGPPAFWSRKAARVAMPECEVSLARSGASVAQQARPDFFRERLPTRRLEEVTWQHAPKPPKSAKPIQTPPAPPTGGVFSWLDIRSIGIITPFLRKAACVQARARLRNCSRRSSL